MKQFLIIIFFIFTGIFTGFFLEAQTYGVKWHNGDLIDDYEIDLRDILYTGSRYVAVGYHGDVFVGVNGTSWSRRETYLSDDEHLFGVAYDGAGTLVAVGRNQLILYSVDEGDSWHVVQYMVDSDSDLFKVAYGDGRFVAVDEANGIWTDTDGKSGWTKQHVPFKPRHIRYGNNFFIVGCESGDIYKSSTGLSDSWRKVGGIGTAVRGLHYGNGKWLASGFKIAGADADGENWTIRKDLQADGFSDQLYSAGSAPGTFVVAGEHGLMFISPDGVTWEKAVSGTKRFIHGLLYVPGILVAVGNGGSRFPLEPEKDKYQKYCTHYSYAQGGVDGTVTVTSPNGGEVWETGSTHDITWTISGDVGNVTLEYSTDNGSHWIVFDSTAKNDGLRPWVVPGTESAACLIRITSVDNAAVSDTGDRPFSMVSPIAASITLTAPNGGESWTAGTTQTIQWTGTGPLDVVQIDYSTDNGETWKNITGYTGNDGAYTWTVPAVSSTRCRVRVGGTDDQSNIRDTGDGPFTIEPEVPGEIVLNRVFYYFACAHGGTVPGPQPLAIANHGGKLLNWTAESSTEWITLDPPSGTGGGMIDISVVPAGLAVGEYTAAVTVSDPDALNSPQTVTVTLAVIDTALDQPPFGEIASPTVGDTVAGSIPVTGWVLDDIDVRSVKIYRDRGIYIGDAVLVEGARPDIEAAYPRYPANYRAGWGYMMLTNALTDGDYSIYAEAVDNAGQTTTFGPVGITVSNSGSVLPFGAIDTPSQGGTASGSHYVNWGWVLTPLPNTIPRNGITIGVWLDGVNIDRVYEYNTPNPGVTALFPGLNNSDGPAGYLHIDTTLYENGVHYIAWTVTDDAGNSEGIGSRYFTIRNDGGGIAGTAGTAGKRIFPARENKLPITPGGRPGPLSIKTGFQPDVPSRVVSPGETGFTCVGAVELEPIALHPPRGKRFCAGFLMVGEETRPLPPGSGLGMEEGIFRWHPGPGFRGDYHFRLVEIDRHGIRRKRDIIISIIPRYSPPY